MFQPNYIVTIRAKSGVGEFQHDLVFYAWYVSFPHMKQITSQLPEIVEENDSQKWYQTC